MKKKDRKKIEKHLEKGMNNLGGFMKEFKNFALKKNILDLAVAVVVGGAFGKIVTSLVNDIIMPLLSMILGTTSFSDLKYVITPANGEVAEVAIRYGAFIQSMVDFLIIAFFIFIALKIVTRGQKALEKAIDKLDGVEGNLKEEPAKPALTKDQELLTEILKTLKQNENGVTVTKEQKVNVIEEKE